VLAEVPAHWRYFVKHKIFAALGTTDCTADREPGNIIFESFTKVVADFSVPRNRALDGASGAEAAAFPRGKLSCVTATARGAVLGRPVV